VPTSHPKPPKPYHPKPRRHSPFHCGSPKPNTPAKPPDLTNTYTVSFQIEFQQHQTPSKKHTAVHLLNTTGKSQHPKHPYPAHPYQPGSPSGYLTKGKTTKRSLSRNKNPRPWLVNCGLGLDCYRSPQDHKHTQKQVCNKEATTLTPDVSICRNPMFSIQATTPQHHGQ
jgi:hypothetical protein